jgi:hypothetical protein
MLAENFGIEWLKVELPFQCEVHWLRPRAIPKPNRFSVLITHTEPDAFSLSEEELEKVAKSFDLVVVKNNRLNLENAIEDCFGSTWITETPRVKEYSVSYLLSAGNHAGVLPGYKLRKEIFLARSRLKDIKTDFYKSKYFDTHASKLESNNVPVDLPLLPNDEKSELFKSMFHIAVENTQENNYFTEKIIDCFKTYTVPIYNGCLNIIDHFNEKGIITFSNTDELVEIVNRLKPEDYFERLKHMQNNFELAEPYFWPWDRLAKKIVRYQNQFAA